MNYLPWRISASNKMMILDSKHCMVVNLSHHFSIGVGHSPIELSQFIVKCANDLAEEEVIKNRKPPLVLPPFLTKLLNHSDESSIPHA